AEFSVDCKDPHRFQRLHLLIVSPQSNDAPQLQKQFDKLFGIETGGGPRHTKAFQEVPEYLPLTGDRADRRFVDEALFKLHVPLNTLSQLRETTYLAVFY